MCLVSGIGLGSRESQYEQEVVGGAENGDGKQMPGFRMALEPGGGCQMFSLHRTGGWLLEGPLALCKEKATLFCGRA